MRINRSIISNQTESVPVVRTLTINGTTYDLTQNRTWTVSGGGVTGSGTTNYLSKWTSGTALGNSLVFDNGTNVGIGTATPSGLVTIAQSVNSGTANVLYLSNTSQTGTTVAAINFINIDSTIKSSINAAVFGNDFMTFNVGSNAERMRIDSSGNVGIGNNNAIYKLDVNGGSSFYLLNLESTWNNSSLVGYGINVNITNTASDPSSYLLRLAVSNNDYFSVKTDGRVYMVLPTSSTGLSSGELWNDGGTIKIV